MTIHASWSLLRLFQLTNTETALSHLMSNLVRVMSKFVYTTINTIDDFRNVSVMEVGVAGWAF